MIFEKQEQYYERTISYLSQKVANLEVKTQQLETRIEIMRGVLYLTFTLSTIGVVLIIEQLLYPWLRTL